MKTIDLSNNVIISDPCYELGIWCQMELNNMKPGNYIVHHKLTNGEDTFGERSSMILIIHQDHQLEYLLWDMIGTIGVDSGQAGIFDKDTYRKDDLFHNAPKFDAEGDEDGNIWYNHMCDKTLSEEQWGTYDRGVVSSSGFGDGMYETFTATVDNEVVGICIDFNVDDELDIDFYKK